MPWTTLVTLISSIIIHGLVYVLNFINGLHNLYYFPLFRFRVTFVRCRLVLMLFRSTTMKCCFTVDGWDIRGFTPLAISLEQYWPVRWKAISSLWNFFLGWSDRFDRRAGLRLLRRSRCDHESSTPWNVSLDFEMVPAAHAKFACPERKCCY